MPYSEKTRVLMKISAYEQRRQHVLTKLQEAVLVALSPGLHGESLCTYQEVAEALGVTRQAVHERYGPHRGGR